ncbi:MAG: hypothetical protein KY475_15835 [Planctomycetes bacterium]|nr:hypothetical protein [Planctomycetota bacterium]
MFMLLIGIALMLAWVSHNYRIVQQRKEYWPQFNDHDFSVRAASVFKVGQAGLIAYPKPKVPWIRRVLGDHPTDHLIYNPTADPNGLQLRRTRNLFPEAKVWGWQHIEALPDGIERLTDQHYVMI